MGFVSKSDELMHVLVTVWCNDIYETQIDSLINHYGEDVVRDVEEKLYNTTVFRLIRS